MAVLEGMQPFDVALFVIPFVTAPISLASSAYIVYLIYRKRRDGKNRSKPREHILLGLSLLDMSFSFALSFSTIPGPAVMTQRLPTLGTVATCTAQGFFVQLGLGAPLYNACLCIYYVLRVRYQVSDDYLMKWAIPSMHVVILVFSLGTAVTGLVLDLFNYAGVMGCWIHHARFLCGPSPQHCDRGQGAEDFEIYFGLIHVALSSLIVIVTMIILWCTVRSTEARSRSWDPTPSEDSRPNNNMPLTRRTAETGFLYSATFLAVWLPTIILGMELKNPGFSTFYRAMQIAAVTLQPLQGFFNMLIYTSPKWLPWLRTQCCCCSNPEQPPRSSRFSSTKYSGRGSQGRSNAGDSSTVNNGLEHHNSPTNNYDGENLDSQYSNPLMKNRSDTADEDNFSAEPGEDATSGVDAGKAHVASDRHMELDASTKSASSAIRCDFAGNVANIDKCRR